MTLKVTADKNDNVIAVERDGEHWRWRFKRDKPARPGHSKLSEEQIQEMLAMYVDYPDTHMKDLAEMFGLKSQGSLNRFLHLYGVPMRGQPKRKPRAPKAPTRAVLDTSSLKYIEIPSRLGPDPEQPPAEPVSGPRWRVSVRKVVQLEFEAASLAELESKVDGEIILVERLP
jgi:hypothetical protein